MDSNTYVSIILLFLYIQSCQTNYDCQWAILIKGDAEKRDTGYIISSILFTQGLLQVLSLMVTPHTSFIK